MSNPIQVGFKVVINTSEEYFQEEVNKLIESGYQCLGGVSILNHPKYPLPALCISMVKYGYCSEAD